MLKFTKKFRANSIHRMLLTTQLQVQDLSSACLIPKTCDIHWLCLHKCQTRSLTPRNQHFDCAYPENISVESSSLKIIKKSRG